MYMVIDFYIEGYIKESAIETKSVHFALIQSIYVDVFYLLTAYVYVLFKQ